MELLDVEKYGYGFVPQEFLPPGEDEYSIRDIQARALNGETPWRGISPAEIETLTLNGCRAGSWNDVFVSDPFDPALIRNTSLYGRVRIGRLEKKLLKFHDFCIPSGIRNSVIVSCDIGDDCAIQDCVLMSHYIIGARCIISRVDELVTTNHAKFGNGILKDGEREEDRIWIDVMNESGGRSVLPFAAMIPADAYLWAAWRDDTAMVKKLKEITQEKESYLFCGEKAAPRIKSSRRGFYGTIGAETVIKSCRIIKDAAIGESAYIKGANKLKNISILSDAEETTQIGEGVELTNGIVGFGCRVFYGAKAVRFVLGSRCGLKYGARLIHSVLGDNSTVSCCEILNNLVFPIHEQHHNNSFLIASLIEGMSNMAAAATIGSNHNSRANDGEIRAGRGFWPGLSVMLKHSSRFASYCLINKGDYPYELNITLPFSLVANNAHRNRLEIMPAYFWIYNLYALERNLWKAVHRDKRVIKTQRIENDYLAPDTAEEIIAALLKMENWFAEASIKESAGADGADSPDDDPEYDSTAAGKDEVLTVGGMERHSRKTVILKPRRAAAAYREMLFYYGMKTAVDFTEKSFAAGLSFKEALEALGGTETRQKEWINLGGQIASAARVDTVRKDIREGKLSSWEEIHARYGEMAAAYENDKARHAWAVLSLINGSPRGGRAEGENSLFRAAAKKTDHPLEKPRAFMSALEDTLRISAWIKEQVKASRAKDFLDPFRSITFRGKAEMDEVAGRIENNSFVRLAEEKHRVFAEKIAALQKRLAP